MTAQSRRRPSASSFALAALAAGLVLAAGAHAGPPPRVDATHAAGHAGAVVPPQAARATLAPALSRSLAGGGKADFLVTLREKADLSPAYAMDWTARGRYVYRTLKETADRSQAPLKRVLQARGARVESNWITNTLVVRGGDLAIAQAAQRSAVVARVEPLPVVREIEPEPAKSAAAPRAADGIAANIRQVRAPLAWADGTTGAGVTVGVIDHGPLLEHEALVQQFRGRRPDGGYDFDYNWFDPQTPRPPMGDANHGSHVLGIMVGDNRAADPALRERVGVAPGAQWIGCEGFPQDMPTTLALMRCAQFMLAPTKMDGSGADPDRRPVVVNNSWFTFDTCNGGGESAFRDAIDAWVAAGIVPVFAQGNTQSCDMTQPPGLQSVPAPASLSTVFAVGSTGNHDGLYAPHSTWGPTTDLVDDANLPDPRGFPQLKPQLAAPGVTIHSVASQPGGYVNATGTSMSAPHVAGTVALMLDAGPCLRGDYARIGTILMQTARGVPYDTGGAPPPGPGNVPNYATGWGELDAYAAANAAAAACGPQGFVRGHVRNAAGAPIAGAIVEIYDQSATPLYRLVTEADGGYTRRLPERTGTGYRIRAWAYGYLANDESGVVVAAGADTLHEVSLANAPVKTLSGTVRDAATGWPLHARIAIAGYPGREVWSDPVSGFYAVALPTGSPFRFDVTSDVPGYLAQSREAADVATMNGDFALDADLVRCEAPGYAYGGQLLSQDFESNGASPPSGWTRSSNGLGWNFGDSTALSVEGAPIPAHGSFAASNDAMGADFGYGNDGSVDLLVSPVLNLATATQPVLRFASFYPRMDDRSRAVVEGSRDGGATWQSLGQPAVTIDDHYGWSQEAVSLAPLAGSATARVRFHADDGTVGEELNSGAAWGIDDVAVRTACTAPAGGGLVTGHVRDANDAAALDGADVRVGSGTPVRSATSADPAVGRGFYVVHAPAGAQTVRASRGTNRAGYADAQANVTLTAGRVVTADLALTAGRLRVYPSAGPVANVALGNTADVTFSVGNHGGEPLAYSLQQAPVEEHFDTQAFPPDGWHTAGAGNCGWRLLNWNELNTAGGDTNAAVANGAGCLDETEPYDVVLTTPSIDLSGSVSAAIGFFVSFDLGTGTPRLDLDVSADGGATWHTEWSVASDLTRDGPGTLVERDLTAYAGAADVRVRFRMTSATPAGRAVVDQVHLFNSANSSPLVHFTPDAATLAAGATREVTARFDARNLPQPGVYALPLRIAQDTPYDLPYGDVRATVNVTAPTGWGAVAGLVRGLGECDANPYPLAEAQVEITNPQGLTYYTTTDADGRYRYWRPAAEGPFRVTVTVPDHLDKTTDPVALAAGGTATADVDLRVQLPCIATAPSAVSADVPHGQSLAKPFDIVNLGPAQGPWSLRVGGDPTVRVPKLVSQTGDPAPSDFWRMGCATEFGTTLTNTYLRVFPLKDSTDPADYLTVSGLEFGITEAVSPEGTQPAFARLYALDGELRNENLRLLRELPIEIPDAALARQHVSFDPPLRLPRATVLVAAIHSPTGTGLGRSFYMGTNMNGESTPGYWISPDCDGLDQPTPVSDIVPGFALLLDLEVQASDACGAGATPVSWLGVSPASGTVAGDGGTAAQASFDASGLADGTYQGSMCLSALNFIAPVPVPVTLRVGAGDVIFRNGFEP